MTLQFIHNRVIKDPLLIGYELEVKAASGVLMSAIHNKIGEYVLCFGMPGCGKSLFAEKVAYFANSNMNVGCSVLHFQCNTSAIASDTESIEHDLYNINVFIEQQCPLIISLDELDFIAPERLRQFDDPKYSRLSLKLMGLLGSQFGGRASPCGGLLVLLLTNAPLQLESALLDRVSGGIIYFPLPNRAISTQILQHFAIQQTEEVFSELIHLTPGVYFTGRGLYEACKRMVEKFSANLPPIPVKIAEAIFSFLPPLGIDQRFVDKYRDDHRHLIRQAKAFLDRC